MTSPSPAEPQQFHDPPDDLERLCAPLGFRVIRNYSFNGCFSISFLKRQPAPEVLDRWHKN